MVELPLYWLHCWSRCVQQRGHCPEKRTLCVVRARARAGWAARAEVAAARGRRTRSPHAVVARGRRTPHAVAARCRRTPSPHAVAARCRRTLRACIPLHSSLASASLVGVGVCVGVGVGRRRHRIPRLRPPTRRAPTRREESSDEKRAAVGQCLEREGLQGLRALVNAFGGGGRCTYGAGFEGGGTSKQ